jgi:hypothetical protein
VIYLLKKWIALTDACSGYDLVVSQRGACYLLSQFGYAIMLVIARQNPSGRSIWF